MADPWPSGQWQDHDVRQNHANQLYHQLSMTDMDESELDNMLQLVPPWQYWEQGLGELKFGRTSASAVLTILSCLSPSQGKFKFHDSPGLLLQPFNPAFGVNTEVYWPQSALAMPGSSQLLQPFESFPVASQAGQDHFIPAPQSDLSQPTPSGLIFNDRVVQTACQCTVAQARYQSSAGSTNHPHAMMNPELQPSAGSYSTLHAQAQRQLSLGSFGSMVPSSIDDDMTQLLQRTRNKRPSSGLWTSKNTTPRNVPHEEAKMEMISSIFEHGFFPSATELTQWATDALNAVVALYANKEITSWKSMGGGKNQIKQLKGTITTLHRDFTERIDNLIITGFQLTFDLSESKAQMDLQRNTAIAALLLNNLFLYGNLRVQMNTNQFQMFRVPLANPLIINFMEEMLSRQQYSHFIPFHVDNNRWEKCVGNTAYFIATICHSKLRKIGGIDTAHFPNQRDKDWYALSIRAIDSFTAQRLVLFNCFIQGVRRMLGF
ncbi:hypothetical protein F4604DRAFT_1677624 [Suillus subluteus]|nr:hypothetical protein F4604DRAFT_1677624 [Suillus subluteus]